MEGEEMSPEIAFQNTSSAHTNPLPKIESGHYQTLMSWQADLTPFSTKGPILWALDYMKDRLSNKDIGTFTAQGFAVSFPDHPAW